jgi:hypothetical protein
VTSSPLQLVAGNHWPTRCHAGVFSRGKGSLGWVGPELGEDGPQRAYARREGVAVALNDVVRLLGESDGFVVCQVKVHDPDMVLGPAFVKSAAALSDDRPAHAT